MKRLTVEECESLNVSTIIYHLRYDRSSSHRSIADELAELSQKSLCNEFAGLPRFRLLFTTTRCHFGGVRYWFLCPTCNKRVGKLYAPLSADEFKCRHCHNLAYASSQTHNQRVESLLRQLDDIISKEGQKAFDRMVQRIQRTRRGRGLLLKVYDRKRGHFPPPYLARKNKEEEGYNKYIKLLFEV